MFNRLDALLQLTPVKHVAGIGRDTQEGLIKLVRFRKIAAPIFGIRPLLIF